MSNELKDIANELKGLLKRESGNKGLVNVLTVVRKLGAATATSDKVGSDVKKGAMVVTNVLGAVIGVLNSNLDPDTINLDELFVKKPSELLAEKGISQDEIDRILQE
ncbi:MAG: hypothetical protein ACMUIL_03275 [bacterium]